MLSIFNQSIDFDYLTPASVRLAQNSSYDDIDSIAEYLVESFMDNDHYTSENDDDSGNPINKHTSKTANPLVWFYVAEKKALTYSKTAVIMIASVSHMENIHRTCKGFFNIVSPPPDFC
jgi:hypothetical protein